MFMLLCWMFLNNAYRIPSLKYGEISKIITSPEKPSLVTFETSNNIHLIHEFPSSEMRATPVLETTEKTTPRPCLQVVYNDSYIVSVRNNVDLKVTYNNNLSINIEISKDWVIRPNDCPTFISSMAIFDSYLLVGFYHGQILLFNMEELCCILWNRGYGKVMDIHPIYLSSESLIQTQYLRNIFVQRMVSSSSPSTSILITSVFYPLASATTGCHIAMIFIDLKSVTRYRTKIIIKTFNIVHVKMITYPLARVEWFPSTLMVLEETGILYRINLLTNEIESSWNRKYVISDFRLLPSFRHHDESNTTNMVIVYRLLETPDYQYIRYFTL